jgi:hypothetical protein
MHAISTHRPWYRRLIDDALEHLLAHGRPATPLYGLDARTLADIGVDASEIDSIEAESRGPGARITRRRIALANH